MKKIIVTGAKGMLGQDLCPLLEDEGFEVVEVDLDNLDILDFDKVNKFLELENPDCIIHCAAYTDVDGAEDNLELALKVNESATGNLALQAKKLDIPIVYISTDYVFDGLKTTEYTPSDNPNPINNYGLSKLKGEEAIKNNCTKYYIARTSWLYGHHGKNFVETMINLAEKNEQIKVVDDQTGCPTWTMDLAEGIIDLILEQREYGIYHICSSGYTSWYGFALKVFEILGKNVKLIAITSKELNRKAKRPKFSVMDNGGCCAGWEDSLKTYLKLRSDE